MEGRVTEVDTNRERKYWDCASTIFSGWDSENYCGDGELTFCNAVLRVPVGNMPVGTTIPWCETDMFGRLNMYTDRACDEDCLLGRFYMGWRILGEMSSPYGADVPWGWDNEGPGLNMAYGVSRADATKESSG